ncbi:MAG TPA: hypothetical protein VEF04_21015 [Blastocatellia bacterium]|nr:hypothetical protein [Blastocatellia bacterium]
MKHTITLTPDQQQRLRAPISDNGTTPKQLLDYRAAKVAEHLQIINGAKGQHHAKRVVQHATLAAHWGRRVLGDQ